METNTALQKDLQANPEALAAKYGANLVGAKAEMPTRMVFPVSLMGEANAHLLLENPDDNQAFSAVEVQMGRTMAIFLGELETVRMLRQRIHQDRKSLEALRREQAELKQLVAMQHTNLENSQKYARLVSQAMLPGPNNLGRIYEDSFLLFKPRENISGTFYWFSEKYYKLHIAIADTRVTGIGGTFLALMYTQLLESIASSTALPKPRNILLSLNDLLRENYKEIVASAGNLQGLRMGLVSLDETVQVLRYAGADLPLWLLREGEVKRLNSSTVPLGVEPFPGHKVEIKQHTLQMQPDDRVYLAAPGILELKGGLDNSALGIERFRQMLMDASVMPVKLQQNFFQEKLEAWTDGRPQSHDILLCGLQFMESQV
jgi:serine phosphatase RsbU (regulator of sigma subunit)